MKYEWYMDGYFLYNFLMDAAALLFAAVCCNRRVFWGRILLAAAAAVTLSTALLLLLPVWLLYILLVHLVLNPAMTFLAFFPKSRKDLFSLPLSVTFFYFLPAACRRVSGCNLT